MFLKTENILGILFIETSKRTIAMFKCCLQITFAVQKALASIKDLRIFKTFYRYLFHHDSVTFLQMILRQQRFCLLVI